MVAPLHRRVGRTLHANPGRHLGSALLILLGAFYFVAATGIAGRLEDLVVGFARENRQEDLTFSTNTPIGNLAAVEREAGAVIEARRQVDLQVPEGELRLLSSGTRVNRPAILSGRGLENPGEVLLDPNFLKLHGLAIGGQLDLDGRPFRIAGTVAVPNYVYIIKNLHDVLPTRGFGIGVVSSSDLEAFPRAVTVYATRFDSRQDPSARSARLHELLSQRGHSFTEWLEAANNKRIAMPWGNISSMKSMSLPVSLGFFLLSCLIVGVMVWRIVKLDSVVIGTLYALGYRRAELTRHYLAIPLLISAAGGLAGALLAVPCVSPVVAAMQASYVLPDRNTAINPLNVALALLMPMALAGLTGLLAIHGTLRKTAVELMKGDTQGTKVNFLERALRLERFGFDTRFQIREQVRSIPRLLFLLLGVTTASMTLLYGFTWKHSMEVLMTEGALARYRYAVEYNFKEVRNLQDGALPERTEPYHALRGHPEGRASVGFYVVGMQPDSVGIRVKDLQGRALPRDQVNISSPLAARLSLHEGDTVRVIDELDGRAWSLTINGIVAAYGEQFIFMPLDEFNRMTGQRPGSYRTVLSDHLVDFDQSQLAGVMDARNPAAFEELSAPTTTIVISVTSVALLIAIIILYLVTSLRVEESRYTISLLKVFGYRGNELKKLILSGSGPGVVIGFCLGVPFMVAFAHSISDHVAEAINMLIPVIVSRLHVLISFVLILAVHETTKRLSGRKLAKIPMSEALKAGTE